MEALFIYLFVIFFMKMKLSKERDSLAMTAKKLGRDLAKVILFFLDIIIIIFFMQCLSNSKRNKQDA